MSKKNFARVSISLFILIVFHAISYAHIKSEKLLTPQPIQYKKVEWEMSLKTTWKDPYIYTDVMLDMVLTSPSGKELVLPCYYVEGKSGRLSTWKANFTPIENGNYSYYFQLSKKEKVRSKSKINTFLVATSEGRGFLRTNNNWSFKFDNGEIFRGIGENIGWESRVVDDSKYFRELHENPRFNYEFMLRKLSENGGNFFRTWMCQWNLPLEWKKVENNNRYADSKNHFNESVMPKMDRLVELCDSLGVYVMLAMDSHVNLMGGFWKQSNYNQLNGGPIQTASEFFTNAKAKIQYKSRLRYLVAIWSYSPSIGAWEFFNEVDNASYNGKPTPEIPDSIITAWHTEMSSYLKQIDAHKHLVTTSISHRDINGLNSIPDIDFNQKHIYVNTEAIASTIVSYSEKFQKPYVIGEFARHWDWSLNFNEMGEEFDRDFKRGLWFGLFSPTPVLPMTWWWEFFDLRNMTPYFAKVKRINDEMISAGKGEFIPVNVSIDKKGIVFGVKCGNKNFIYLNNNTDSTASYNISVNLFSLTGNGIISYNPEKGEMTEIKVAIESSSNGLTIKDVKLEKKEELIFIIGN